MKPYIPTSLHSHIRSHSVFVFEVGGDGFGSGVLVNIANRVFVLSAEHVIRGDIDINLGIVPHQSRFTILNKWSDEESDIGFLELDPFEVNIRLSQYSAPFSVHRKILAEIPSNRTRLALCGFPRGEAKEVDGVKQVPVTFITVALLAYELWTSQLKSKYDPKKRLVIPYGEKWGGPFVDGNKIPRNPISPFGLSGCGLWHFDPETQDSDKPVYSLIGIQHSTVSSEGVLVCTPLDELIDRFSNHYGINIASDSNGGAA